MFQVLAHDLIYLRSNQQKQKYTFSEQNAQILH